MTLDWFPTMLSGDQQAFADSNWRLSKTILDMCDANSDVYDLSTEEEKAKARLVQIILLDRAPCYLSMRAPGTLMECTVSSLDGA